MDINDELILCIHNNDINGVITTLEKGANVNCNAYYPMEICVTKGFYEIAKLLIDKGAVITDKNYELYLVDWACQYGHNHIMELLFDNGITLDDCCEINLIKSFMENDDVESFKLLIRHGLKFDTPNNNIYIMDKCLEFKKINILQFIADNYLETIPNNIRIVDEFIKKYHFIKMLINRQIIDIAD